MGDSHIYDTYEKEFKTLHDSINKKISSLKTSGNWMFIDVLGKKTRFLVYILIRPKEIIT
ncbi:hypothetical protein BC833DRAFT_596484 [Globomyces pollinis-pini]|nr:hypothetical protein BC833DRAFT_596484 [Globomyces pollinis-pini]